MCRIVRFNAETAWPLGISCTSCDVCNLMANMPVRAYHGLVLFHAYRGLPPLCPWHCDSGVLIQKKKASRLSLDNWMCLITGTNEYVCST